MKILISVFLLASVLFFLPRCAQSNNNNSGVIMDPNGSSELALLMREMYDSNDEIKKEILKGKIPSVLKNFNAIKTAEATEPEKVASPLFAAMADNFLLSLDKLKKEEGNYVHNFNSIVDNCMNCHQEMCPGPMVRIKKLYIKN